MGMRLQGPSGGFYTLGIHDQAPDPLESEHRLLQSLHKFPISTIERLLIVSGLEIYVLRVEYRFYETEPRWYFFPGEDEEDWYDSSW